MNDNDEPIEPEIVSQDPGESLANYTAHEIDAQVSTAKKYPRLPSKFRTKAIEMVTLDVETAEACIYSLKRSGKAITGPSVRFAEVIAGAWGNLRIASRTGTNTGKTVSAVGVCHDLETNTAIMVEKMRRITDRDGKTFNDDMQVVTANAALSIALRDAVLRVVPKAMWKPVYDKARALACGEEGTQTFLTRRATAMKFFKDRGIAKERVLLAVQKPREEDISLEDLETLIGFVTAIKNGDAKAEDLFPMPEKEVKLPAAKEKPAAMAAPVKKTPAGNQQEEIIANEGEGKSESPSRNTLTFITDKLEDCAIASTWFVKHMQEKHKRLTGCNSLGEAALTKPADLAWIKDNWSEIEKEILN